MSILGCIYYLDYSRKGDYNNNEPANSFTSPNFLGRKILALTNNNEMIQ